ncbi:hypothetical protein A2533_04635 [Candidatus Falkowbacteria bacterium RIFOXYD2_FULL_35_9]|uniref:PRC-barrel domain-containing protein n=1 Tax=Candidatus Falkowbacteria bacterium RIFOXYC2_FULL_36_12 TaxID=1798002 RepID=A0A1F5T393_9BACT|nr:MAG: hypothetical protein A2478_01610 [Candidatus Falkowbacteria bacterium RIFOXYC2_FULL_36_12]OGF33960.1 MAG: hypothetical protein A2223_03360 [Candidatus Falkowbacteria bacterium RIFOXYA2_FULL_35_8]OGF46060.1 MAG: hypothetical protein A2533_04635 [Candidatus Falkowbacteria bacterium RIFOXYD2_FULL_35_9]
MKIKYTKIKGLPVVCQKSKTRVGKLYNLEVDTDSLKIISLIVGQSWFGPRVYVSIDQVIAIKEDQIEINDAFIKEAEINSAESIKQLNNSIPVIEKSIE